MKALTSLLRHSLLSMTLLALSSAALAAPSQDVPSQQEWRGFNLQTIQHHVLPRYDALADASVALAKQSSQLCKNLTADNLKQAQAQFHHTMDAWQAIQHIRSGPVVTQMRNFSMQFWPDKKNHVGRNLEELLANHNPDLLYTDAFYSVSVSVPGLPALERLLFDDQPLQTIQQDIFRCQVTARIASYVEEMATGMTQEWRAVQLPEFEHPGEDALYISDKEAAIDLLKPLVEQIEVMRDSKILRPLGDAPNKARVTRLESWRSERSLRNLKINLQALKALYQGENNQQVSLAGMPPMDRADAIAGQFAKLEKIINNLPSPIEPHLKDAETHRQFKNLSDELKVQANQIKDLMSEMDIFLGFNSRDGD